MRPTRAPIAAAPGLRAEISSGVTTSVVAERSGIPCQGRLWHLVDLIIGNQLEQGACRLGTVCKELSVNMGVLARPVSAGRWAVVLGTRVVEYPDTSRSAQKPREPCGDRGVTVLHVV